MGGGEDDDREEVLKRDRVLAIRGNPTKQTDDGEHDGGRQHVTNAAKGNAEGNCEDDGESDERLIEVHFGPRPNQQSSEPLIDVRNDSQRGGFGAAFAEEIGEGGETGGGADEFERMMRGIEISNMLPAHFSDAVIRNIWPAAAMGQLFETMPRAVHAKVISQLTVRIVPTVVACGR